MDVPEDFAPIDSSASSRHDRAFWIFLFTVLLAISTAVTWGVVADRRPSLTLAFGPLALDDYVKKTWMSLGTSTANPDFFPSNGDSFARDKYAVTWLWDNCPKVADYSVAMAPFVRSPPKRGERYRMLEQPSWGFELAFDVQGFIPFLKKAKRYNAWCISVYDSSDWTDKNIYMPLLTPGKDSSSTSFTCRCSKLFQPFKFVEVSHSCYGTYPDYCETAAGGSWFYYTPGSGVYYNLGNCVVRYNKIDAFCFLAAQISIASGKVVLSQTPQNMTPIMTQLKDFDYQKYYKSGINANLDDFDSCKTWDDVWQVARKHVGQYVLTHAAMVNKRFGTSMPPGGGTVINILRVCTVIFLFVFLALGVLLGLLLAALKTVHWYSFWLALLCSVTVAVIIVLLGAPYTQNKLPGDWLKKNGDGVDALLDALLEPTVGAANPGKQQNYASYESGCDSSIMAFGAILGYDSIVMTSESNSSYVFNVEIVDLTRISLDNQSSVKEFDIHGICMTSTNAPPAEDCPLPGSRSKTFQARGGLRWQDKISSTNAFRRFLWQVDAVEIPSLIDDNMNFLSDGLAKYQNTLSNTYGGQACDCTECAKNCLSCLGSNSNLMCQDSGQRPCSPSQSV